MNDLPDAWTEELQLWRALSPVNEPTDASTDCVQALATGPFDRRSAAVSKCLEALQHVWTFDDEPAAGDSIYLGCDATPGEDWCNDRTPESHAAARPQGSRQRFGRFLIDRQLGRGGHGYVFRAIDPVLGRPVALKIPNPDSLASSDLRRRFVEESRTLARLEHPNLLSILEAGAVGPVCYLVTPFCSGPSLAEWLREQNQPVPCEIAARLARDLARTVGYVHSRGILHRDIKPSNVLLEPIEPATNRVLQPVFDFVPKLTDFGLAKLVASPTTQTMTGAVVGTPAYMAPEQAEGRQAEVGVASDVYALGAMLYELLTGRPPYCGESIVETLRLVSEGRLAAPGSLRADLPRDLGAICLKCLELEPGRRYRSADELADDLTALLECRPVRARACGPIARLAKWGRRRPQAAALAAAAVVLTIMGVAAISWQWRQARSHQRASERSFVVAHGAVRRFHNVLFKENAYDAPEFRELHKSVLDATIPYYEQLLDMNSSSPELRADVADLFLRLGYVALAKDFRMEALDWFHKSAELWQSLIEENPTNRQYRYFLAKAYGRIGDIARSERDPMAGEWLQKSIAIHKQLIHEFPSFNDARRELCVTLSSLSRLYRDRLEFDQAIPLADRAIEVLLEISPEERENAPAIQRGLADAYLVSAEVRRRAGNPEVAARHARDAAELARRLVSQDLEMPSSAGTLAQSLELIARLAAQAGLREQAVEPYREAFRLMASLVSRYPEMPEYSRKLARLYGVLGFEYRRLRRNEDALQLSQQAISLFERQCGERPTRAELRSGLADAYLDSARTRCSMNEFSGAADDGRKAIQLRRQLIQQDGESAVHLGKLSYSLELLGRINERLRNDSEADQFLREAIDVQQRLATNHPDEPIYRRDLAIRFFARAQQQKRLDRFEEALKLHQQAIALLEELAKTHPAVPDYQILLIRSLYKSAGVCEMLGRLDEAVARLNRGKDLVLGLSPDAELSLADEKYNIAEALQVAVRVRTAAGDPKGGIESEWRSELQEVTAH